MITTSETKTCQNCKNQFTIEPEDFAFYEKIKVPPHNGTTTIGRPNPFLPF